jgi:hypothetical protein
MIGSLLSFAAESPMLFGVFVLCWIGVILSVVVLILGAMDHRGSD